MMVQDPKPLLSEYARALLDTIYDQYSLLRNKGEQPRTLKLMRSEAHVLVGAIDALGVLRDDPVEPGVIDALEAAMGKLRLLGMDVLVFDTPLESGRHRFLHWRFGPPDKDGFRPLVNDDGSPLPPFPRA